MPAHLLLCNDVIEAIAQSLLDGNYFSVACQSAGICRRTGDRWLKHAEKAQEQPELDPDGLYGLFAERVLAAEAQSEEVYVASIRHAAKMDKAHGGDWKAAAFILERRHPDRWGRIERISLQHKGVVGVTVDEEQIARLSDEELDRLEGALDVAALVLTAGREDRGPADPSPEGEGEAGT